MTAKPQPCRSCNIVPWLLAICCLGLWLGGCTGAKQALEKQVADLEREVVRLKAERTNLSARIVGLDDKILLYEKRAERCSETQRERGLEVVRLSPAEVAALEPDDVDEPLETIPEGNGKRPLLTLVGGAGHLPAAAPASERQPLIPVGEGDNLGVVPVDGTAAEGDEATGPMQEFQAAYRAFTNGALDEALVRFGKFLKDNPEHPYADNAMFWRGECYLAKGKSFKAIGEFERLVRRFPSSEKQASALYRIGFAYDRLGDQGKAKEYYFMVVDRHPGSDAARKASRRVAAIQEAGGRSASLLPASATK